MVMQIVSSEEVEARRTRVRHLYTSDWIVDVVTATLMDTTHGDFGCNETGARVKAAHILAQLGLDPMAKTNRDWTEKGAARAATARGVLASSASSESS